MSIDSTALLSTAADLVAIPSINPAYPGGVPEEAVAAYVERFFSTCGVETFRQKVAAGRENVIARVPGRNPDRRVVFEAHMDTVSSEGMSIPPFEPRVEGGRLYGRGSCDTKAGLAAMMHAVAEIARSGNAPNAEVWLAAVVDEEYSFTGVTRLCQGLSADAAIVAEPTELRLITASKGVLRGTVRTRGRAAHSSKPHLGINAIEHMAHVVLALAADNERLAACVHPLLGPATLSIGLISGGEQVNFVPDQCRIALDRRLLPGEDPAAVWQGYAVLLEPLRRTVANIDFALDAPTISDAALETPSDTAVVRAAQEALSALGMNGEPCGVPFGSDASKLSRHGVPSIIFGPGSIDRAHAAVEYVECDQVVSAAAFYHRFLEQFS